MLYEQIPDVLDPFDHQTFLIIRVSFMLCYGCRYWSRKVFKGTRSEKADVDDPRIKLSPVSI